MQADGTLEGSQPGDETEAGQVDPNYVPILPFTEEEERKKSELSVKYAGDEIGLAIDSIEPEGGPITGDTRVLVRGGPFEDMTLIYPKPKCKFGANDRIVEATYVKCHERPLTMEDTEGKSKDKVSVTKRFSAVSAKYLATILKIIIAFCILLIDRLVLAMRQLSRREQAPDRASHDLAHRRLHRLGRQ